MLVGIVGLGVAQNHGALPFQTGVIPMLSAILIVAGLLLLAALGRIAIDVTAEPLLETIAQLTVDPKKSAFCAVSCRCSRATAMIRYPAAESAIAGSIS